jgi:HSP20 family protein
MAVPVRHTGDRGRLDVWEPFGDGAWGPAAELRALTERFSRLLDDVVGRWPADLGLPSPLGELEEADDGYVVRLELPGVKKGDIDVELSGRRLTVRAERKETERKGILRKSTRTTGRFFFDTLLPGEVEENGVEASLEEGVLTVRLPKPESERRKVHKITVG